MLKIAVERENAMMMMTMEKKVKYITRILCIQPTYLHSSIILHQKIAFPI